MNQSSSENPIVVPIYNEDVPQRVNMEQNLGESHCISLPNGNATNSSPRSEPAALPKRIIAVSRKRRGEALDRARSKLLSIVNSSEVKSISVGRMMSNEEIDKCENPSILKRNLKHAVRQVSKAKIQLANKDLQLRQQKELLSAKLSAAQGSSAAADGSTAVATGASVNSGSTIGNILGTELKCGICRQTFIDAMITNCGHTFCRFCIMESQWRRSNCPMCTRFVINLARNHEVDSLLERIFSLLSPEEKKARQNEISLRKADEQIQQAARNQPPETPDESDVLAVPRNIILQFIEQLRDGVPPLE